MFYQYLLYPKYFCCLYLRYPMHFAKKMEILTNTILLDVKNWHSCWTREAIFNNTTMPDSSLFTPFQKNPDTNKSLILNSFSPSPTLQPLTE